MSLIQLSCPLLGSDRKREARVMVSEAVNKGELRQHSSGNRGDAIFGTTLRYVVGLAVEGRAVRKSFGILAVALALCATTPALAMDGDTAPAADYPVPDCVKPDAKLIKPEVGFSGGAYAPDNSRIVKYNRQAKAFDTCMHAYIDTANGAITRIHDKANSDIRQISDNANSAIKSAEARVHDAISEANQVSTEEADAVTQSRK
jgi:hypothetical protein